MEITSKPYLSLYLSEDEIRATMEIIKDESSNVFKKRIVAFNGAEYIETVTNNLF